MRGAPPCLRGERGDGLFDDLPFFLDDLRPQGFLGRQLATHLAARDPRFPADPDQWQADQVGRYLIANSDDLPGNLLLGSLALLRLPPRPTPVSEEDYPELAERVLCEGLPGSSAGGEQPKFTAYSSERGHLLIKFSPPNDNPVAERWRDILISEHHAAETLRQAGVAAAETRLVEAGGRLFLASRRFDRVGEFGRLPMISLRVLGAEFTGLGHHWPQVVQGLIERDTVEASQLAPTRRLWAFGQLIHNGDMHLGNLSLGWAGEKLQLLPVYDMCSMNLAPRGGELPPLRPPTQACELEGEELAMVRGWATTFWRALAADGHVSATLRGFIQANGLTEQTSIQGR